MITYIYECKECGEFFEIKQSIKDKPLTKCFECDAKALFRVIQPPLYVKVKGEPTTVGQLAEQNTRNMSQEQLEKLEEKIRTPKTIDRIPESKRPRTAKDDKPLGDIPAWMKEARTKKSTDINKMNKSQKEKYIMTGE